MKVNNKELEMAVLGCSGATIGARNPVLKAINMRVNVEEKSITFSATNSQILIKKVVAYEEDGDSDSTLLEYNIDAKMFISAVKSVTGAFINIVRHDKSLELVGANATITLTPMFVEYPNVNSIITSVKSKAIKDDTKKVCLSVKALKDFISKLDKNACLTFYVNGETNPVFVEDKDFEGIICPIRRGV